MVITPVPCDGKPQDKSDIDGTANGSGPTAANTALERLVHACYKIRGKPAEQGLHVATKLILVARSGYLCRKDILELRAGYSELVEAVIPLSTHDGYLPLAEQGETCLLTLLASSPGALLAKETPPTTKRLDQDLKARLSFDWILSTKPCTQSGDGRGASNALGISVIVLDHPDHWLQGEEYSHLRDEFIGIDMTIDEGLESRIIEAVKGKGIDGIVTFADHFLDATIRVAEKLGLPTDPVPAHLQSLYKYTTRKRASPDIQALHLEKAGQLDNISMSSMLETLRYPLIVKPCRGGGSRGVSKVNNLASLRQAIHEVEEAGYTKQGILVETYANGPEVDANLMLWKDEILFFELSDEFPALADSENATISDNFDEDIEVDLQEVDLVRSSVHRTLLKLGFHSGVFHVEARVQNSTMRYKTTNGVVDLEHINSGLTAEEPCQQPKVFLIEVNPRPPGPQCVYSTTFTYGVDYFGLQWLRALDDGERFAALCHPFTPDVRYCSADVNIPIHRKNIHIPRGYCDEMLRRLPEIAPYVFKTECFTPGKTVSPIGNTGFIAYFLVYSRASRRHLLEMSDHIKKVSRNYLDGVVGSPCASAERGN
ncbi:hypothetical protein FQN49_000811 [Arthroderma sp. PD_2]|nr:hypothetical protein FQN49_000811 [Arthroderma sp. PD_2]